MRARWLLFLAGVGVMIARAPVFFTAPRFWAEEGTSAFHSAFLVAQSPAWYQSLVLLQRGYFILWMNLATTMAAQWMPLEQAPLVTTVWALVAQAVPLALVVWGTGPLWARFAHKVVCVTVLVLVPLSGEIWLNTANSQVYFALSVLLIVLMPVPAGRWARALYGAVLLIGGLTGTAASLLVPALSVRALFERTRARWVQWALLTACALVQVGLIARAFASDPTVRMRGAPLDPSVGGALVWTQSLGLLFTGFDTARTVAAWLVGLHVTAPDSFQWLGVALGLCAVLVVGYFLWALPRVEQAVYAVSYFGVLGLSAWGALTPDKSVLITPGWGTRYFFLPNAICLLMLWASVLQAWPETWRAHPMRRGGLRRVVLACLFVVSLCWSAEVYPRALLRSETWPRWPEQVAQWRQHPTEPLEIWPPPWKVWLPYRPGR